MLIISTKQHSHTIGEASDIEDSRVHPFATQELHPSCLGVVSPSSQSDLVSSVQSYESPHQLEAVQGVPFCCLSTALSSMSSGIGKAMRVL